MKKSYCSKIQQKIFQAKKRAARFEKVFYFSDFYKIARNKRKGYKIELIAFFKQIRD